MADDKDSPPPQQWTVGGVMAHCEFLGDKGYMNKNTAKAQRAAVLKVFTAIDGEDMAELVDVREVDMDDVLERFEKLARAGTDLSPDSIPTYSSRCRRAVEAYLQYQTDGTITKSQRRARSSGSERGAEPSKDKGNAQNGSGPIPAGGPQEPSLVPYPFPLRPGLLVQLHLPADLRKKEADRIAKYVLSLVMDEPLELSSGLEPPVSA